LKNILYIGNQLSQKDKTETTIDTLGALLQSEGYNVSKTSTKKNKALRLLDMLLHVIKHRKSVDYVLIDTYSTTNFYYAYFCGRLCHYFKLKYIPILHGGSLPSRLRHSPKLSRQLFDNALINVAPSQYLMSSFNAEGFYNITHIPNSIALEKYQFNKRFITDIRLLWVRSFSNIYNPKLAIQILKALKEDHLSASLCMIGPDNDGSLKETRAFAKKMNVEVEFTGKLSKAEWHKKSEAFNVFINTTTIDNTPVSVIEAMALGLPVISTNVGGLSYLIQNENDGVLVESNNTDAFKNAIIKLKTDATLLSKIVTNARDKAEAFDWEVIKQHWFSVLS
jgi:glycosyltransferase involved in cell wall biosynthesis